MNNLELLQEWLVSDEANKIDLKPYDDYRQTFTELINQTIVSILINEDLLCIDVIGKRLTWELDADCCSQTWFADAVGMSNVIGQRVISIEPLPLSIEEKYNTEDGRGKQDEDTVYGYKIRTAKGSFVFSFRNSSNGYYGGDIKKSNVLLLPSDMVDISEMEIWQAE